MEESKWIKQICQDNSIQLLLCEHFIHPTVNDCVVVGNSSFRLLILQSNQIKEVARYDHQRPIISACITYNNDQPEIAFISGQNLFLMIPRIDQFEITKSLPLNHKYSIIISNSTLICMNNRDSTLTFFERATNHFTNYEVVDDAQIWSISFLNEYLMTLEYQNVFKVKIYKTSNLNMISNVSSFVVNYFVPYKFISVPAHSSIYLLCESVLIQFKNTNQQSLSGGWTLSKFPIDIRSSDPLLVDAAPIGVRLFVLTAGGLLLRFDGSRFEFTGEFPGATCISTITISRFFISVDSCRIKLFDSNMLPLDEYSRASCFYSSFTKGNFTVASQFSVHSIFYDYGIEVEKHAPINFTKTPRIFTFADCFFVLFSDRTVILDGDFKDVTPSIIKRCVFERVHANSRSSFFAATSDALYAYEFGSFTNCSAKSDISCHRSNMLLSCEGSSLSLYAYVHSALLIQSNTKLHSCVSAICFEDRIYAALFDKSVAILDDELCEVKRVSIDIVAFSIAINCESNAVVMGTEDGKLAFSDKEFEKVVVKSKTIGNSSVYLMCKFGEVTAMCDGYYFYITDQTAKPLPRDFAFFSPFSSHGTFLGLLKKSKKGELGRLITARFTDSKLGFRSRMIFEFNRPLTKLCSSRHGSDFVCCIGNSLLLFSHGSVRHEIAQDEVVLSITEWKAKHKTREIQFWIVVTRKGENEGRIIILNQSQSTCKVQTVFQKVFNSPITAFAVSSPTLSFFASAGSICGASLETGSFTAKAKTQAKIADVVAMDCSDRYIAALADKNEFALFKIVSDMELKPVDIVRRQAVFGRIRVIGEFVAVSSRIFPALYIYMVDSSGENDKLRIVREVNFTSPVTSIFGANGNALCTCVCGEVTIVACSRDGEVNDQDVSKLFSFSHSALSSYE